MFQFKESPNNNYNDIYLPVLAKTYRMQHCEKSESSKFAMYNNFKGIER